jgi:hypothetical protein
MYSLTQLLNHSIFGIDIIFLLSLSDILRFIVITVFLAVVWFTDVFTLDASVVQGACRQHNEANVVYIP